MFITLQLIILWCKQISSIKEWEKLLKWQPDSEKSVA